jgi:valyl-tRNA synthetase
MHEIPLTNGKHGHTLNATQIFSPDGKWLVFDTRNDDTHISRTGSICKLNITTKEIIEIYKTKNQSMHGPGVGAAAWNPVNDQIIFIHGLLNCGKEKPYSFTRRFGAIISGNHEAGENAEIGDWEQSQEMFFHIPLQGLADIDKLKINLEDKLSKLNKSKQQLETRLASMLNKAPEERIQEAKGDLEKLNLEEKIYLEELSSL